MESRPLPELPVIDVIPHLTIDAKTHLSEIVRYSVASRSLHAAWVAPVESALFQLAQWLTQVDFLGDIRAVIEAQLSQKATEDAEAKHPEPGRTAHASFSSDKDQDAAKREIQLIRRLYNSLQRQKDDLKHVLLTVAAPPASVMAQELEFQVIPASHGCFFELSSFNLPFFEAEDGTTRGEGGSILSGLDGMYMLL
jgi:hypothetical protein